MIESVIHMTKSSWDVLSERLNVSIKEGATSASRIGSGQTVEVRSHHPAVKSSPSGDSQ